MSHRFSYHKLRILAPLDKRKFTPSIKQVIMDGFNYNHPYLVRITKIFVEICSNYIITILNIDKILFTFYQIIMLLRFNAFI